VPAAGGGVVITAGGVAVREGGVEVVAVGGEAGGGGARVPWLESTENASGFNEIC
jgi:hypothetical protein